MILELPQKPLKFLVVCLGNTCRSPAGEYLLRYYAQQSGNEIIRNSQFDSAGLHPTISGMAFHTQKYLELKGMDTNYFKKNLRRSHY